MIMLETKPLTDGEVWMGPGATRAHVFQMGGERYGFPGWLVYSSTGVRLLPRCQEWEVTEYLIVNGYRRDLWGMDVK